LTFLLFFVCESESDGFNDSFLGANSEIVSNSVKYVHCWGLEFNKESLSVCIYRERERERDISVN
jgi:hypothetical protein